MKKVTSLFYISLAVLVTTFFSCKLKVQDSDLYDKPLVNVTDRQVTIVIPLMNTDTKYINVYRRDKQNDKAISIGILYHPEALEKDNKNYIYIDNLVKKGHSYQYSARYYINGRYYLTEWSDTINTDKNGSFYDDSISFAYKMNDAILIYEKTENTIQFNKTIDAPTFPDFHQIGDDSWKPALIVKNSTTTQAFELSQDAVRNRVAVPLVGMLPSSFLDTDITIEALVGQKTIYDNDKLPLEQRKVVKVIWTEPAEINVQGAGGDKKINVKSQSGMEGLDYSRKAQ